MEKLEAISSIFKNFWIQNENMEEKPWKKIKSINVFRFLPFVFFPSINSLAFVFLFFNYFHFFVSLQIQQGFVEVIEKENGEKRGENNKKRKRNNKKKEEEEIIKKEEK